MKNKKRNMYILFTILTYIYNLHVFYVYNLTKKSLFFMYTSMYNLNLSFIYNLKIIFIRPPFASLARTPHLSHPLFFCFFSIP